MVFCLRDFQVMAVGTCSTWIRVLLHISFKVTAWIAQLFFDRACQRILIRTQLLFVEGTRISKVSFPWIIIKQQFFTWILQIPLDLFLNIELFHIISQIHARIRPHITTYVGITATLFWEIGSCVRQLGIQSILACISWHIIKLDEPLLIWSRYILKERFPVVIDAEFEGRPSSIQFGKSLLGFDQIGGWIAEVGWWSIYVCVICSSRLFWDLLLGFWSRLRID